MKITYLGHAAMLVEAERRILIDPFLTGNPVAGAKATDMRPDAILLSHGHSDHLGDTVEIAKASGAVVVAVFELAMWLSRRGVKVHPLHIGGSHEFDFGRVKFTLAFHGSGIDEGDSVVYGGQPAGIILTAGGKTLYHAGDTALFGDMRLIGERNAIDVAALPIGDNFTMGPEDALTAAQWIGAKKVIPMHYDTFPLIQQDADAFVRKLADYGMEGHALKPGQSLTV